MITPLLLWTAAFAAAPPPGAVISVLRHHDGHLHAAGSIDKSRAFVARIDDQPGDFLVEIPDQEEASAIAI